MCDNTQQQSRAASAARWWSSPHELHIDDNDRRRHVSLATLTLLLLPSSSSASAFSGSKQPILTTMLNKAWAEAKFCNQEGYGKPLTCGMTFKDAEDVMNRIHEIGPKLFPKWAQYAERHKTFFDKPGAKLPRAQTEDLFVTPTEEEPEDNNIMIDEE